LNVVVRHTQQIYLSSLQYGVNKIVSREKISFTYVGDFAFQIKTKLILLIYTSTNISCHVGTCVFGFPVPLAVLSLKV